LSGLRELTLLSLNNNHISDLTSVGSLIRLREVHLGRNQITDIAPLKNLRNLETALYLANNQIEDISDLAGFVRLRSLVLRANRVTDISPLGGLVNLQDLCIGSNSVSNLMPLSPLTRLRWVTLDNNPVTLAHINSLRVVMPQATFFHNIPVPPPPPMIALRNQRITDERLAEMIEDEEIPHNVEYLDLSHNRITVLTSLKMLSELQYLYLSGNQISLEQVEELQAVLPNCIIMHNAISADDCPFCFRHKDECVCIICPACDLPQAGLGIDGTCKYRRGFTTGFEIGDRISVLDALEILKYLADMPSTLYNRSYGFLCARAAADINGDGVIDIEDVFEIMCFIRGLPSELCDNDVIWRDMGFEVVIREKEGKIEYYNTAEITQRTRTRINLKIEGEVGVWVEEIESLFVIQRDTAQVLISSGNRIAEGELIMTQNFSGLAKSLNISGDITPTVIPFYGDVNGDGEINIFDALEILKYLAGMENLIVPESYAWRAARVTGGDEPVIFDALEILKMLAGMESVI
jgi:hypothetical protein